MIGGYQEASKPFVPLVQLAVYDCVTLLDIGTIPPHALGTKEIGQATLLDHALDPCHTPISFVSGKLHIGHLDSEAVP